MTIEQLTKIEEELYAAVIEICEQTQTTELKTQLNSIFNSYRQVHKEYANLAENDNEALKRGLFIQWYALTEPSYLTGIGDIDAESEKIIMNIVEERICNNNLDYELEWMLNYYANWDYVYDKFNGLKCVTKLVANKKDNLFPTKINREEMQKRGQMGGYWNSLSRLT